MKRTPLLLALAACLAATLTASATPVAAEKRLYHFRTTTPAAWPFLVEASIERTKLTVNVVGLRNGFATGLTGDITGDNSARLTCTNAAVLPGQVSVRFAPDYATARALWTNGSESMEIKLVRLAVCKTLSNGLEGKFTTVASWPEVTGYNSFANRLLTSTCSNYASSNVAEFMKSWDDPDMRDNQSSPWAQDNGYRIFFASDRLFSVRLYNYGYTGGAHPNRWTKSFTFGISGESARQLTLDSLLKTGGRARLLEIVKADLAGLGASTAGELKAEALDCFVVTPLGLEFNFDPYVAGCYAEGDYVLLVKWNALAGIVAPGLH